MVLVPSRQSLPLDTQPGIGEQELIKVLSSFPVLNGFAAVISFFISIGLVSAEKQRNTSELPLSLSEYISLWLFV